MNIFLFAILALGSGCRSHCEKTCECYVKKRFKQEDNKVDGGFAVKVAAHNKATSECIKRCEKANNCNAIDQTCCP